MQPAAHHASPPGAAPIELLPQDLLVAVFAHFRPHPLQCAISRVCRRWHAAAALALRTFSVSVPTPERLALLSRFARLTSLSLSRPETGYDDVAIRITLPSLLEHLHYSDGAMLDPPYPPLTSLRVGSDRHLPPALLDAITTSLRSLQLDKDGSVAYSHLAECDLAALTSLRLHVLRQHLNDAHRLLNAHASQLLSLHLELKDVLKEYWRPYFFELHFPALRTLTAPASARLLCNCPQLAALTLLRGKRIDFARLERKGAGRALEALVGVETLPSLLSSEAQQFILQHPSAPLFTGRTGRSLAFSPQTLPHLAEVTLGGRDAALWTHLPHCTAATILRELPLSDRGPPPPSLSLPRLRAVELEPTNDSTSDAYRTLAALLHVAPGLRRVSLHAWQPPPSDLRPLLQMLERAGVEHALVHRGFLDADSADADLAREFCWLHVRIGGYFPN